MPFTVHHHTDSDLYVIEWNGALSLAALKRAIDHIVLQVPAKFVLWDFSHAAPVKLVRQEIESLVNTTRALSASRRAEGKTALVVSSDFLFGLARQAQTYASLSGPGPTVEIFRDRKAALAWFQVP